MPWLEDLRQRGDEGLSLSKGLGISAKNPEGTWGLEDHLIYGSSRNSFANDPWISSTSISKIAKSFSGGNGIIGINLRGLNYRYGYNILPRTSPGYHFSIWQQEISIYQHIPQSAIKINPILPRPIRINIQW